MSSNNNNNNDDYSIRPKTDMELLIEQEEHYRDWHLADENKGRIKCWDCHKEAETKSPYGYQYTTILVRRADENGQLTNTQFFFRCPQCNSDLRLVEVVSTTATTDQEEEK